jgi:hypothetical protein
MRQSNPQPNCYARQTMTVTNNLRPTTFPPVQRERPSPTPDSTAKPAETLPGEPAETLPGEPAAPVSPGGLVGKHVNTTA